MVRSLPYHAAVMNRVIIATSFVMVVILAVWLGFWAGESGPVANGLSANTEGQPVISSALTPAETLNETLALETLPPNITKASTVEGGPQLSQPSGPERIEEWLSSSTDIPTIANKILISFPSLEAKDHLLAASKLVALVSDDRFEGLKRLLFDPKTSLEAKEFLFRDALSRAETVKLPLLLEIMQMPEHPCANEARETLKTQLGVDYGVNYGQWQSKISEVLKAQGG